MSEVTEPIRKIATVLPISDELLEDAASVQTYLNGRLTLLVSLEEERQLLRGAGTNELVGIFGRSGINQYTRAAADDNLVALAKVIANRAGSSYLVPDTVILHPTNWLNTRLLRDGTGGTIGQYFGGGPFSGAYGAGGAPGMFGQSIWNTRVVLSTYVGAGTALVGNFSQAAHVWRRGGVSVEATNSHSDYFVKSVDAEGRGEARAGRVPAGRLHRGARPDLIVRASAPSLAPIPLRWVNKFRHARRAGRSVSWRRCRREVARAGSGTADPTPAVPSARLGRHQMEFTPDHLEILFRARVLGTDRGQVLEAWLYPEAHALAENGWLRRQFEENGDVSWWLTAQGDTALDLTRSPRAFRHGRTDERPTPAVPRSSRLM